MMSHRRAGAPRVLVLSCLVTAAATLAAPAEASVVPGFEVLVEVDGGGPITAPATPTDLGNGIWNFQGAVDSAVSEVTFDINASDDPGLPGSGAFVGSNFTVKNLSNATQTYRLLVTLDLATAAPDASYAGSAGFGLSGTDGLLQTLPGVPLWQAFADGNLVDGLFDAPMFLTFTGDGSASTSDDLVPGSLPEVSSEIAIELNFTLSPGDTLGITGAFAVIPGPAGIALLAGPLLAGTGRRRA